MKSKSILIYALLLVFVGGVAYYAGTMQSRVKDASDEPVVSTAVGAPMPNGDGSMMYSSAKYGFRLEYPADLGQVTDHDEGGDIHTILFENPTNDEAFQIYVQPYTGSVISDERFRADRPSGVMSDPVDVLIDGERATIFYSEVEGLGKTREVWFIKNGYLFAVTTYADLDSWLAEIMKTWKFL